MGAYVALPFIHKYNLAAGDGRRRERGVVDDVCYRGGNFRKVAATISALYTRVSVSRTSDNARTAAAVAARRPPPPLRARRHGPSPHQ